MNIALVTCTDGNYIVRSEHGTRDEALIAYDNLHAALVGDPDLKYGTIKLMDENLDCFENRGDVITHEVTPPEPEPEPEPEDE